MGCQTPGKNTNCCGKTVTETQTKVTEYGTDYCKMPKGTLQYTGARYVPVFANPVEWSANRPYEHLTMVQHMGATYISRQAVPVGAQLPTEGEQSNDYWVFLTNWNAQIEQYRQDVERLSTELDNEEETRANADTALGTRIDNEATARANADTALGTRIDDNTSDIETILNSMSLNRPKFAIIGDSWSATNEAGTYGIWVNAFSFYTGLTPVRLAVSGSGFTRGGNNKFLGQLSQLAEREDLDEIGFVILYGGVNDWRYNASVETMLAEIQNFRTAWRAIKKNHPHLTLYTVLGNIGYAPQELYNGFDEWIDSIAHTVRTTGAYQLENFINGVHYWLTPYTNAAFLSDTLHPSQSGHFVIAAQMIKIVTGCYQGTVRSGRIKNETLNTSLKWEYKDGIISFSSKPINKADGITLPAGVGNNNLGSLTFKPYIGTDVKRVYGTDMYVDYLTEGGVVKIKTFFNPNVSGSDTFYLTASGIGASGLLPITCPGDQAVSDGSGFAF